MKLRPGQRLYSAVSPAQMIVVRAPATDVEVACGGASMLEQENGAATASSGDVAAAEGPALGKRYADEDLGLELLCTKAGDGELTVDGRPLPLKSAKPLPSSD